MINDWGTYLATFMIGVVLSGLITAVIAESSLRDAWEKDAIARGVGRYGITNGRIKFEWAQGSEQKSAPIIVNQKMTAADYLAEQTEGVTFGGLKAPKDFKKAKFNKGDCLMLFGKKEVFIDSAVYMGYESPWNYMIHFNTVQTGGGVTFAGSSSALVPETWLEPIPELNSK